jgi:hypothetical protein
VQKALKGPAGRRSDLCASSESSVVLPDLIWRLVEFSAHSCLPRRVSRTSALPICCNGCYSRPVQLPVLNSGTHRTPASDRTACPQAFAGEPSLRHKRRLPPPASTATDSRFLVLQNSPLGLWTSYCTDGSAFPANTLPPAHQQRSTKLEQDEACVAQKRALLLAANE